MKLDELPLPLAGDRFRLEFESGDTLRVVRKDNGQRVGSMKVESLDEGLTVRALCIDEGHRSYGAGSEAARLFNNACDTTNVPLVRTWAPPDRGLAVYFWIRMGYRPLHGKGPEGGLQFERRRD